MDTGFLILMNLARRLRDAKRELRAAKRLHCSASIIRGIRDRETSCHNAFESSKRVRVEALARANAAQH